MEIPVAFFAFGVFCESRRRPNLSYIFPCCPTGWGHSPNSPYTFLQCWYYSGDSAVFLYWAGCTHNGGISRALPLTYHTNILSFKVFCRDQTIKKASTPPTKKAVKKEPTQINRPSLIPRSLKMTRTEAMQGTKRVMATSDTRVCPVFIFSE